MPTYKPSEYAAAFEQACSNPSLVKIAMQYYMDDCTDEFMKHVDLSPSAFSNIVTSDYITARDLWKDKQHLASVRYLRTRYNDAGLLETKQYCEKHFGALHTG